MLVEPPQARTLRRCAQIALLGHEALAETLRACNTPAGLAARALALLDDVGTDELGSFKSTLSRNLKWLDDPSMQTHQRGEGFSLRRIVQEGGSVYVCLPADEMADFRNWLRIVVRIALDAKQALGTRQSGLQTLFLLDEFPVLGTFPLIEQSAGYMAGYGIKLAPVIQNLGQIKNLYAKNWETFLGNAGGILGWGLNDAETETYLADRMGKILRWEYTVNDSRNAGQSSGRGGGSESSGWSRAVNHALQERVLRYASEVHIEAARHTGRAFVLPADGAPFAVLRRNYFEERDRRWYDDPEFLAKWEMGYAARAANA